MVQQLLVVSRAPCGLRLGGVGGDLVTWCLSCLLGRRAAEQCGPSAWSWLHGVQPHAEAQQLEFSRDLMAPLPSEVVQVSKHASRVHKCGEESPLHEAFRAG